MRNPYIHVTSIDFQIVDFHAVYSNNMIPSLWKIDGFELKCFLPSPGIPLSYLPLTVADLGFPEGGFYYTLACEARAKF